MKELDKETKEALAALGLPEEEIGSLEEQQKGIQQEENVKVKEDETPESEPQTDTLETEKKSLLADIVSVVKQHLSRDETPEPEPTAEPAVEEQPKAEKEVEPAQSAPEPTIEAVLEESLKVHDKQLASIFAQAIVEAITPLQEDLAVVKMRLGNAEKAVEEKVLARISELPPVAKVRATEVAPTVEVPPSGTGLPTIKGTTQGESALKKLMDDIAREAARKVSTGQYEV